MNVYIYFCVVCDAVAIGLILGAVTDVMMENGKRGRHERRGAR